MGSARRSPRGTAPSRHPQTAGNTAAPATEPSLPALPQPELSLSELSLSELRAYRRRLSDEEDRVSYWRRLVHARIDVLEADDASEGPMSLETLSRVLGDTGNGRSRTALVRVKAADPLPELPVLTAMWTTEVTADEDERARVLDRLGVAEKQLTSYRAALHRRLDQATEELIARYQADPGQALAVMRESVTPPSRRRPR